MTAETIIWVAGVYGAIAATVVGIAREWWQSRKDTNPLNWREEE